MVDEKKDIIMVDTTTTEEQISDVSDASDASNVVYIIKHSDKGGGDIVAVMSNLFAAVDLCSKRRYFVRHGVWRNMGNERVFDDFVIHCCRKDTFPMECSQIDFIHHPEEKYREELDQLIQEKKQIMERARTAEDALRSIEKIMYEERGDNWKCTLEDKEIDILVLFEDAMYEECIYEPWDKDPERKTRIDQINATKRLKMLQCLAKEMLNHIKT